MDKDPNLSFSVSPSSRPGFQTLDVGRWTLAFGLRFSDFGFGLPPLFWTRVAEQIAYWQEFFAHSEPNQGVPSAQSLIPFLRTILGSGQVTVSPASESTAM